VYFFGRKQTSKEQRFLGLWIHFQRHFLVPLSYFKVAASEAKAQAQAQAID
jgi:hypothetical protein